ncbi:hypothetical protein TTHERM_00310700 (macronuclear) [Tetrahymena thermophila SB210]|uniref:Uncharacterized protein n=1 Tax=Tetrahymena thermophila (strain SB210) TaxID=312017 RepID=I7ML20_TETTS|nr:hypothetical protein TTHERM_00310700 [Tetrahymena thermophila SB210]EAS00896.2 hypothetical protein TTHERM_00310700 [Tetrahymena thermophila SB210]|eukprot:XP_001021142.2 hypothetical protein TTHERM_00310700 [Tetrahymena thermophila SB210]
MNIQFLGEYLAYSKLEINIFLDGRQLSDFYSTAKQYFLIKNYTYDTRNRNFKTDVLNMNRNKQIEHIHKQIKKSKQQKKHSLRDYLIQGFQKRGKLKIVEDNILIGQCGKKSCGNKTIKKLEREYLQIQSVVKNLRI